MDLKLPFAAYNGNEPYIFISYAYKDTDRVFPITEAMAVNCMPYTQTAATGKD